MHVITLIHTDREEWAEQLTRAIADAVRRNSGDSETVCFNDYGSQTDLVLCLGSPSLVQDLSAQSQIAAALEHRVRVLPIVSSTSRFKSEVPSELYPINGLAWGNPGEIGEEVLRHLGLTERDRRVFLSYLRRETTPLAYQLYDELHRRGFSVFLDSFEIEHGAWVQNRIEQALQHSSFVLLLYSQSVESSEWVEKEINFALAQGLGLAALALPGTENCAPFKMTPSDRRLQLERSDLQTDGQLTPEGLKRVCIEVECEHADQFRARRERLIQDVSEALGAASFRVGSQSLRYKGKNSEVFIRLSPRPPEARDLHLLDEDCPITDTDTKPQNRVLVAVKGGYEENRELTEWLCGGLKHQVRWREPQAICANPEILEK
jgi:hypothetical protein